MATFLEQETLPRGHHIYNFDIIFFGHYHHVISFTVISNGVEKEILKEMIVPFSLNDRYDFALEQEPHAPGVIVFTIWY